MKKNGYEIEKWNSIEEYTQNLINNGWTADDIEEQLEFIRTAGEIDWNDDGSFEITLC